MPRDKARPISWLPARTDHRAALSTAALCRVRRSSAPFSRGAWITCLVNRSDVGVIVGAYRCFLYRLRFVGGGGVRSAMQLAMKASLSPRPELRGGLTFSI